MGCPETDLLKTETDLVKRRDGLVKRHPVHKSPPAVLHSRERSNQPSNTSKQTKLHTLIHKPKSLDPLFHTPEMWNPVFSRPNNVESTFHAPKMWNPLFRRVLKFSRHAETQIHFLAT